MISTEGLGDERVFEFGCETCEGLGYIKEPCTSCDGKGWNSHQVQEIITIPMGVETDSILKFPNLGHLIRSKGTGELWITLDVSDDPRFKREGTNISSNLNLSIVQAALGDRIYIDTVTGKYRYDL